MRHLAESVRSCGFDISDTLTPSPLYKDNTACIQWSHNMTTKKIRHMGLRKNSVREWVADKTLNILHVSGRVNPADIFTKEMRDRAHFWRLQNSFMCHLSDFIQQSILVIHHQSQSTSHMTPCQGAPSAASSKAVVAQHSYFAALCSIPICQTFSAISHLSSAGCQLIQNLHHVVPSGVLWDPISSGNGVFSAGFFSHTKSALNPLWLVALPAPLFMDARMGGVVPRVPRGYLLHSSWNATSTTPVDFSLVP
jgi:hypothetical protein